MALVKTLLLSLFFAAAVPLASASAPAKGWADMSSGRYEIRLDGLLCHTCVALIVEEAGSLKEVEKASADFEQETLFLTVRPQATLKVSRLKKALARAAKRVDLGTAYEISSIRYKVK